MLDVLFENEQFIAINKPNGLLVHKTNIAADASVFAMQVLRDQVGYRVYPIHRLDRPTSGVLLFGKDQEAARLGSKLFAEHQVNKEYLAVVRGFAPEKLVIDHPLKKENDGVAQQAVTDVQRLASIQLDIPVGPYPTCRFSLMLAKPQTGRMHQIRRHFAHIRHYIIRDKRHGEVANNKLMQREFGCEFMLLHAWKLQLPLHGQTVEIVAPLPEHFQNIIDRFDWNSAIAQ